MKQVCLISCYLGKLPDYFQIYLDSCSWNSDIDWLIFNDSPSEDYIIPENVRIIKISIDQIRTLIKEKIYSKAKLDRVYKLCDYKPTYGIIFDEYLIDYEYWGHCDIDIIWGNLNPLINLLKSGYDRYFRYGHLTLYRNVDKVNNIFKLPYSGPNYKQIYTSNISCAFDESCGTWRIGIENGIRQLHKDIMYDIHIPGNQKYLLFNHGNNPVRQAFLIDKGRIIRYYELNGKIDTEERLYLHFQKRKPEEFPERLYKDCIYQFRYNSIVLLSSLDYNLIFDNNFDKYPYSIKDFWNWWKVAFKYKLFYLFNKLTK